MALPTAQNQIAANVFKTWLIMFFFSIFVMLVVYVFARGYGFPAPDALSLTGFALILAGIMNFLSYFYSDKMVLAISGAKRIQKKDNPTLFRTVENLCIAAGLPMPKIYVIPDSAPNAFATGRDKNHAAICFTEGILGKLNKLELEGVTSHELSHINNRDTLLMSVVSILVGFVALLADWFLRMTKNANDEKKYWVIRRESFNLLRHHIRGKHTAPFIDDIVVNPEALPEFLPKLNKILAKYPQLIYTVAGHVGNGNFHIIPLMDLKEKNAPEIIKELSMEVYDLVLEYHGSITGEHNDGLIRSPYLKKMYGEKVYELFEEVKKAFDPKNIFNPGKKVGSTLNYSMHHLEKD